LAAVQSDEVRPGLLVHLDTAILRERSGSMTNAEPTRAVVGPHYFLVLEVDRIGGSCLAVPLFSKRGDGRIKLEEDLKSGEPEKWIGEDSYFYKWQHWQIPLDSIATASVNDESLPNNRRRYADNEPKKLAEIAAWKDKNHCQFCPVAGTTPTVEASGLTDAEKARRHLALERARASGISN
jgi:hypothetical protein